jgi:hypothetical protein
MPSELQVGNLASSVGDRDLLHLFEPHGAVCSATVATHRGNGRSTGVGFVERGAQWQRYRLTNVCS